MHYFSLNNPDVKASFKEAVVNGIAPDKGLYFPSEIPLLLHDFIENLAQLSNQEIAFQLIKPFVNNEIPDNELKKIADETLSFDFPLVKLDEKRYILELFHGPTLAFKDVGARFMARCLGYFNKNNPQKVTVLVATSGDTGGAVADGFFNVEGVEVVILFPKGRVSEIQQKQLTTFGKNITAIQVEGSFDDCQAMVKKAFLDKEITDVLKLTSANSINVARWIPQMFYYAFAWKQLAESHSNIAFCVPSGNFGNICAAAMLQKMGLPIHHLIAATNANDVVPVYLKTGNMVEKKSVSTISNAMDVALPSNFVRIQQLYSNDFKTLSQNFTGFSFTDYQTRECMKEVYQKFHYMLDPHGAVAVLGMDEYHKNNPDITVVALETAHPCKFDKVVRETLHTEPPIPERLNAIFQKEEKSEFISNYEDLKVFLIN